MSKIILIFCALGFLCGEFQSPTKETPTREEKIKKAILQLGSRRFALRERAKLYLWKAGKTAEPYLKKALLNNQDLEVSTRIRSILDRFRFGIYPDTPKQIVDLVNQYHSVPLAQKKLVVQKLMEQKRQGYIVVLRLAAHESQLQVRHEVYNQIANEMPKMVLVFLEHQDLQNLEELLQYQLYSENSRALRDYVAFVVLTGKLDGAIDSKKANLKTQSDAFQSRVLIRCYRAKRDYQNAGKIAKELGDFHLVKDLLWEEGNWQKLLPLAPSTTITDLGYLAFYQRRLGKTADLDKTMQKIIDFSKGKSADSGDGWYSAEALFLNDRPEDALKVLRDTGRFDSAFVILKAQGQYEEALSLVVRAGERNFAKLDRLKAQSATLLAKLGEKKQAEKIFRTLTQNLGHSKSPLDFSPIIKEEIQAGFKELAFKHAAQIIEHSRIEPAKQGLVNNLVRNLFPDHKNVPVWWKALQYAFPNEAPSASLKRLDKLLTGPINKQILSDLLSQIEKANQKQTPSRRELLYQALADFCLENGHKKLAVAFMEKEVATNNSPAALTRIGKYYLRTKQYDKAQEIFTQCLNLDPSDPISLYLHGKSLEKSGDILQSQSLMKTARIIPLGNEQRRYYFWKALGELGYEKAARQEREFIEQVADFDSWFLGNIHLQNANQAVRDKKYFLAADKYERFMLRCLETNSGFQKSHAYLTVPHRVHHYRALGFLQQGRLDQAVSEAKLAMRILPNYIRTLSRVVPVLENKGRKKQAQELFDPAFAHWQKICKAFPNSASAHNSLAWLAATCRQHLDIALRHSETAVKLKPNSSGYLDTLAEIYFQKGNQQKAIQLMRQCIKLSPDYSYYRGQLERFKAGDVLAPIEQ